MSLAPSLQGLIASLLVLSCCLSACERSTEEPRAQAFEPAALSALMRELSREASALGDEASTERFRAERLSPLIASDEQLLKLLQPRGGAPSPVVQALMRRYRDQLAPRFLSEAPAVLAEAHRAGLRRVAVTRVGPSRGAQNTPGDLKLLEALPKRPPLYHVRYLPEQSPELSPQALKGLRLNGFIYTRAGWRALFKLGESLESWRASDLE